MNNVQIKNNPNDYQIKIGERVFNFDKTIAHGTALGIAAMAYYGPEVVAKSIINYGISWIPSNFGECLSFAMQGCIISCIASPFIPLALAVLKDLPKMAKGAMGFALQISFLLGMLYVVTEAMKYVDWSKIKVV